MLTALEHDGVNHQTRRGLNNAIQAYVFGNDQLAHSVHQVRPRKGYASAITTTKQLHSLTDSRARLCEIDKVIFLWGSPSWRRLVRRQDRRGRNALLFLLSWQ